MTTPTNSHESEQRLRIPIHYSTISLAGVVGDDAKDVSLAAVLAALLASTKTKKRTVTNSIDRLKTMDKQNETVRSAMNDQHLITTPVQKNPTPIQISEWQMENKNIQQTIANYQAEMVHNNQGIKTQLASTSAKLQSMTSTLQMINSSLENIKRTGDAITSITQPR